MALYNQLIGFAARCVTVLFNYGRWCKTLAYDGYGHLAIKVFTGTIHYLESIARIVKAVVAHFELIKIKRGFKLVNGEPSTLHFFAYLFQVNRGIKLRFRSGLISLMKGKVRNDFSVALEHIEQVKPLTCNSALTNWALAAPIDTANRNMKIFKVFM
jgi:hypothetical protein